MQMHGVTFAVDWSAGTSLPLEIANSDTGAVQVVNEDGMLAWSRVTVFEPFFPQLPDTPFRRMTTAAGQVCTYRFNEARMPFGTYACQHTCSCRHGIAAGQR